MTGIAHRLEAGKTSKVPENENKRQTACSLKAGSRLVLELREVASGQDMKVRTSSFMPSVMGSLGAFRAKEKPNHIYALKLT